MNTPRGEPRTPPPGAALTTVAPREGASLVTTEPLAQAVVYLPSGSFGAGTATVRLEPRSPGGSGLRTAEPFTEVPGGTIVGNVYRLSADVDLRPGAGGAEIRLRPPFEVVPEPVVARLTGGRWEPLPTRPISNGILAASLDRTGDYALVVEPGESADEGSDWLLFALAPLLLLFVLAALGALHARRRRGVEGSEA